MSWWSDASWQGQHWEWQRQDYDCELRAGSQDTWQAPVTVSSPTIFHLEGHRSKVVSAVLVKLCGHAHLAVHFEDACGDLFEWASALLYYIVGCETSDVTEVDVDHEHVNVSAELCKQHLAYKHACVTSFRWPNGLCAVGLGHNRKEVQRSFRLALAVHAALAGATLEHVPKTILGGFKVLLASARDVVGQAHAALSCASVCSAAFEREAADASAWQESWGTCWEAWRGSAYRWHSDQWERNHESQAQNSSEHLQAWHDSCSYAAEAWGTASKWDDECHAEPEPEKKAWRPAGKEAVCVPESTIEWNVFHVASWLNSEELGEFAAVFQKHKIIGATLLDLTREDLKEMGIECVGDQRRLLNSMERLRSAACAYVTTPVLSDDDSPWADLLALAAGALANPPMSAPVYDAADQEQVGRTASCAGTRLTSLQIEALTSLERNPWQLDPSQNVYAERQFANLTRACHIDELRHGHGYISNRFSHGPHAGESVHVLIQSLVSGSVLPRHLPKLVAARWRGCLWIVYGNRRLFALKEYARQSKPTGQLLPLVDVIVHDAPFGHLEENVRRQFMVKFVLALDTVNGGQQATMRGRRNAGDKQICKIYARHGCCKYGDRCYDEHRTAEITRGSVVAQQVCTETQDSDTADKKEDAEPFAYQ